MGLLSGLDWAIVAAYFAVTLGVAMWSRGRGARDTTDYFLAGKNVGWFVVGASVFASNIGSEHLVGLAGAGADTGVPVAHFEMLASFVLLLLGWLFVPFYIASGVTTMPEFLEKRYSAGPRYYLAGISILGYILTKISVTIAAGGIVFETLMGIDFWTGAVIVVVVTGAYTFFGGMRAVLYTDMFQMFVLIGGSVAVTIIGLNAIGGWDALRAQVEPARFDLWRPMSDPDFPWTGILFGAPILAVWYWCTDQFIVQRVLSARGITEARRGVLFAAWLKQLPLFIFVLPGMIAFALAQSGQLTMDKPDQALPALVGTLLPAGLKGLVAAGLLAALMSSLSSVFNSCSTLITIDVVKRLRPDMPDSRLLTVGRVSVLLMTLFGLLWIPMMDLISGRLYTYIQSVQAYISPPIAAVFLVGILWSRANAKGAAAALAFGFVLGIGRLVLEINAASLDGVLLTVARINFLHFAFLLFVGSVAVLVGVSLATARPDPACVRGLTLSSRAKLESVPRSDVVMSILIVALILVLWLYFSPLSAG